MIACDSAEDFFKGLFCSDPLLSAQDKQNHPGPSQKRAAHRPPRTYRSKHLLQRAAAGLLYKEGASSAGGAGRVLVIGIDNQGLAIETYVWSKIFSQIASAGSAVESLIANGTDMHDTGSRGLGYGRYWFGCVT